MNRVARFNNATESGPPTGRLWSTLPELGECWRYTEHCSRTHRTILDTKQHAKIGLADAHRVPQHGLKHGSSSPRELEMAFKTSEVAVCCSSDSLKSSVRWRSSLSSRVFSMAMTAWAAKFLTSSICLSVNGRTSLR